MNGTLETHHPAELALFHMNPRVGDVDAIMNSLRANGQYKPVVVNRGTHTGRPMEVLAGNHTVKAFRDLLEADPEDGGWRQVSCWVVDVDDDRAARIVAVDNRTSDIGSFDDQMLVDLLESLPDLEGTGYSDDDLALLEDLLDGAPDLDDLDGDLGDPDEGSTVGDDGDGYDGDGYDPGQARSLAERFGIPPFTVIDTRNGKWRARSQAWKALGIKSEIGRGKDLLLRGHMNRYANWMEIWNTAQRENPHMTRDEVEEHYRDSLVLFKDGTNTSVFDPTLVEILVSWFAPRGGHVLDPWAGGSVRGVVSAALGRDYTGIDLSEVQVQANREQWQQLEPRLPSAPIDTAQPALDLVADERPTLKAQNVTEGPGAQEALALYAATSSLPLREEYTTPLPYELHEYLQAIYDGAGQELRADVADANTQEWARLPDNTRDCWVAFTGGKDSVAAALQAEQQGYTPILYHLAGLNRGMSDELGYAQKIAGARGWRLVVERVSANGKKQGLVELPTKNQVTALLMLNRMAAEGANRWTAGWHRADTQEGQAFGYDYSDGTTAVDLFNEYLDQRYPGHQYLGQLYSVVEAWAEVADAGLLRLVKGCVCPIRFKEQRRSGNVEKYGPLLEGRCGSCVKCAWEQHALERLGLSKKRPEYMAHLHQFIERAFEDRNRGDLAALLEWLVPTDEVLEYRRDSWPTQLDPDDAPAAEPDETLPHIPPSSAEGLPTPEWVVGDSRAIMQTLDAEQYDMVIGCPPYYDLEQYSDDPADLSSMTTEQFDAAMADTLTEAARCLRPDSFAAFVVGSARDKQGNLRDMKRCMIDAAEKAGMALANDAVLLNSVGSTRLRAGKQFARARSLGRCHQEIVIFVKGSRREAARRCGEDVYVVDLPGAPEVAGPEVAGEED